MNDHLPSGGFPPTPSMPPSPSSSWHASPQPSPPASDANRAWHQLHYFKRNASATAQALLLQLTLAFFIQIILSLVLVAAFPSYNFATGPALLATLILSSIFAHVVATLFCSKRTGVQLRRFFAGVRPSETLFLEAVGYIFAAQLVGGFLSQWINAFFTWMGVKPTGFDFPLPEDLPSIILYGILICIVAPVTEELLFRGAILNSLSRYGNVFAVVISAILFSLFHMNFDQIPFAFFAGLTLGFLAIKTGSITYAIILHAINNTTAFVLTILTEHPAFNSETVTWPSVVEIIYTVFVVIFLIRSILLLVIAFYEHRKKAKITGEKLTFVSEDPIQRQANNIIAINKPYAKFFTRPAVIVFLLFVVTGIASNLFLPVLLKTFEDLANSFPG